MVSGALYELRTDILVRRGEFVVGIIDSDRSNRVTRPLTFADLFMLK